MTDSYWTLHLAVDALVAGLKARPLLSGVQVEDGWPGDNQETESIWFHDADTGQEDARMTGGAPTRHSEVYDIFIICDVLKPGGTTKEARDRLTVLSGEVMNYIATQKRLSAGGDQLGSARVAGWKYRTYVTKTGRGCSARIQVRITARR